MKSKHYQDILQFLLLALLLSCSTANSPHDNWMRGADKVEVFKLNGATPVLVSTITEQKKLDYFRYLFDFTDTEAYKCGYNGMAKIYQGDKVMEIFLQLDSTCEHAAYTWEGKDYYKKLTHDGQDVLGALLK